MSTDRLFNMPFGLNIKLPTRTLKEAQKTLTGQVSSLWEPVIDFFEKNDKVFNGDVSAQIDLYNRQTYNLGAIMRDVTETHNFDTKI